MYCHECANPAEWYDARTGHWYCRICVDWTFEEDDDDD